MINLQQLFRAFSRVSSDNIRCSAEASGIQHLPAASSAVATSPLSIAAGISASSSTAMPPPSPTSFIRSPASAVVAAACTSSPAAEAEIINREGLNKTKNGMLQLDTCHSISCSPSHVETMPLPAVTASSLPISPCRSPPTEPLAIVAAVAAGGAVAGEAAAPEVASEGHSGTTTKSVVTCKHSSSSSDLANHTAKETGTQEVRLEASTTLDAAVGADLAATVLAYPPNAYGSGPPPPPPAAAAALLSHSSHVVPHMRTHSLGLSSAPDADSDGAATAAVASVTEPTSPAFLRLINELDSSSTTVDDNLSLTAGNIGGEPTREINSIDLQQVSCSTSCSTSTSSSNSPATSSSGSPTTSCVGSVLSSCCSNAHDTRALSLSFSSASDGLAVPVSHEEFRPLQLSQQHQTAAGSEAPKEGVSPLPESTLAAFYDSKPQKEKLHASAALAAALAAAEADKLRRTVISEKLQHQRGVGCVYRDDSSGDSTAEASPACADFSSLLKEPSPRNREEEEEDLLTCSARICLNAGAPATSMTKPGTAAIASAFPVEGCASHLAARRQEAPGSASDAANSADISARHLVIKKSEKIIATATHTAASIDIDATTVGPLHHTSNDMHQHSQRVEAGNHTVWKTLPEMTGSLYTGISRSGCSGRRHSGVDSSDSDKEDSEKLSRQQEDARAAGATRRNSEVDVSDPTILRGRDETDTAVDTTVVTGEIAARDAVEGESSLNKEVAVGQDAEEGALVLAKQAVSTTCKDIKGEFNTSDKMLEERAVIDTAPSPVAPRAVDYTARDGDSVPAIAATIDSSTCFSFFTNEVRETQDSSTNSNRSLTTTDRSRSNTSTGCDECGSNAEKCFSAALSADPGLSPQAVSLASTREEKSSELQLKLQQSQESIKVQSAKVVSDTLSAAAAVDGCSAGERLKVVPSLRGGSGNSLAFLDVDKARATDAVSSATEGDASAAAAVTTWLSSLLPQQQLCAAASAALLPGLLLQQNIYSSANSLSATASEPPASTASSPASEEVLSEHSITALAKEQAPASSLTDSSDSLQVEKSDLRNIVAADAPGEAKEAAATKPSQEVKDVDTACQEHHEYATPPKQQIASAQQQAESAASTSVLPESGVPNREEGKTSYLNVAGDGGCLAATTADVSPASVSSSSSSALSGSPSIAATCMLPASVLPPSLLLRSAVEAPLISSSLPVLSSLASAVTATDVAAATRSLDAAAQNALAALPVPLRASAAVGSRSVFPSAAASGTLAALQTTSLAATLPSTPVLAATTAGAGTLFPAAGCPSTASPSTTASTTAPSRLHPLAAFRSGTGTPHMRTDRGVPNTAGGLQQDSQSEKGLLLESVSSPSSSPSSSAVLSRSSLSSSSVPPSFAALAVALQAGAHKNSSRVLPPSLAARVPPSPLQTNSTYTTTAAALLDRKQLSFPPTTASNRHLGVAASIPAVPLSPSPVGASSSASSAGPAALNGTGSTASAVASTVFAAATPATGAAIGALTAAATPAASEKQMLLAGIGAVSPFSRSLVPTSASSSSTSAPAGGSADSTKNSSSIQSVLPLMWPHSSAAFTPNATASALQQPQQQQQQQQRQQKQQEQQKPQQQHPVNPAEANSSATGKTEEACAGATARPGAVLTSSQITPAADLSAAASSLAATAVGVSPVGGVIDCNFWGSTAQQLLLQLNLQQLQQQQGHVSLNNLTLSSAGVFLPHLCLSPLETATAADYSARAFSLNCMQQQHAAAAAAARTAALLQAAAAAARDTPPDASRGQGPATGAANGAASAPSSDLSGLLTVAAAMKEGINTRALAATSTQKPVDSCSGQQQWHTQTCGLSEATSEQANSSLTAEVPQFEREAPRRKDSLLGRRRNTYEQQIQQQQNLKKPTAMKKQHHEQQLQRTKKEESAEQSRPDPAMEGPPVKRARRAAGGSSASSGAEPSSSSVNHGNTVATGSSGFVHLLPLSKNSADATAALRKLEHSSAVTADRGAVVGSAAAGFAGMQPQLLAHFQQNQLLLQGAAAGGEKFGFGSLLPRETAPLSGTAAAAPVAATTGVGGISAAVHPGFKYVVESLCRPSVTALAAVSAASDRGAATFTPIAPPSGPMLSAFLNPRAHVPGTTALGACLPTPTLLPEILPISNSKEAAKAAATLHLQTLQQLQRLHFQAQQQRPEAGTSACSFEAIPGATGLTVANLRGKGSVPGALGMPQQQQRSSSNNGNSATGATGEKFVSDEHLRTSSCSNGAGMAAATKEALDALPGGGSNNVIRGGSRQQQQKRPQRLEQQQRQHQRQATNPQRQEQSTVQQGVQHQHHPGVCYSPPKDVWRARITVEGRQHEQQFSVKRHGFEEARLLAVQWRSQMERLRLGGEGGLRGGTATGTEAGAPNAGGAPAKTKGGATGTNKSASSGSRNSSGSTTCQSISGCSTGRKVTHYPTGSNSSPGLDDGNIRGDSNTQASTRHPGDRKGEEPTLKRDSVSVSAPQQQNSLGESLTACCADPTYKNLNTISQLTGLSSSDYRPLTTFTNNSAVDTGLNFLTDPLSQMRTLAMRTRHLMHAKSLCGVQQQSNSPGARDNNINDGASSSTAAVLFAPGLLGFLDPSTAEGSGGSAMSAPAAGPSEIAAVSRSGGDSTTASAADAPALTGGSQLPAAALGCSWEAALLS